MCNRAVGLISRVIEEHGIPTVSLSINREWSAKVPSPRTGYVKFPYGAPFGEPGNANQQMTILRDLLVLLQTATTPGAILDLPYRWRKSRFGTVDRESFFGVK